ncbi:hypothetical protein TNCV_4273601 [Trichonephila clavipes]|nr:hypothetical protein TNCV_4273601 [Trichonephila clavipes]
MTRSVAYSVRTALFSDVNSRSHSFVLGYRDRLWSDDNQEKLLVADSLQSRCIQLHASEPQLQLGSDRLMLRWTLELVRMLSEEECEEQGTPRLLAMDLAILNHGQATWTTPELTPPLLTSTPLQRENAFELSIDLTCIDSLLGVVSCTGLELMTRQPRVRYLDYLEPTFGSTVPARLGYFAKTVTAGSDVVQSGRPIFDDFFQHLWPYMGNNTGNVVFQMVKRLWLIRIDQ